MIPPPCSLELLVIDDSPEDREIIRSVLGDSPERRYRIREAVTAATARSTLQEYSPHCVLLDYNLPDSNGFSFLQDLTQGKYADAFPVILMTGMEDRKTPVDALSIGAQDFVPKRVISTDFLDRVIGHAMIRFALTKEAEAANRALAESESLLRMAQDLAGTGTFHWNLLTGQTSFAGSYFKLHGLPPDHPPISHQEWLNLIHPDDRHRISAAADAAINQSGNFEIEYRVIWPDNTTHWLLARGAVIHQPHSRPVRLIGVTTDITQSKTTLEAVQSVNAELQHFTARASHDLQTPLRTVGLFAELLERMLASSPDDKVKHTLGQMRSGIDRMHRLIDDLLTFARTGENAFYPSQPVPLQQPLDDALKNLESVIKSSAASITVDQLPVVQSNSEQMVHVFQNLLGNAIKYSRPEVPPAVHIAATRRPDDWLLKVSDNGRGFDMRFASLIFQPFNRLESKTVGTGLGLAICKRIIERSGGQIWVESQPGVGTTFFFTCKPIST